MSDNVTAAEAAACSSRSFDVQLLAGRVEACADQLDAVLASLSQLQLMDWQSPAGIAYRTSIGLQAAALARARDRLNSAAVAVRRHAQNVSVSSMRTAAGGY
ncbi:hypothetical protein [Arthrobacter sp. ISL-28]|uniref:hypothetical protein n=1 Tax=Arthrobacter sp. ISL-28 TaxID=2819108 RepID=UPI001BEA652A|nr:hypothetical protein [Arthrobacter sp. ISL-28]MBT2522202.1 hypothetical protein [Arthrobacter sp. ISL-28]